MHAPPDSHRVRASVGLPSALWPKGVGRRDRGRARQRPHRAPAGVDLDLLELHGPLAVRHDLGVAPESVLLASAKEGLGVDAILEAVVERVPPPEGDPSAPLRALIFDSYYDKYRGAIPSVRVVDGTLTKGMKITFGASESVYEVLDVGYNQLRQVPATQLTAGEVGYVVASVKSVKDQVAAGTLPDEVTLD